MIQQALCLSIAGDEIVVAPGTYAENLQFCGPDVVLRSSDVRNPAAVASTIIDGGGAGPTVWFVGTETEACLLSGFTIRNGKADYGGGIYGGAESKRTQAAIEHCMITGNWAKWGGGLMHCDGTIKNNRITANSSAEGGGGLYACDGKVQNNTIAGNSAGWCGGGLAYCDGAVWNNMITGNSADDSGGGLWACDGTIYNNTICANSAELEGGGLGYCSGAILDCIVWGNSAPTGPQLQTSPAHAYSCIQGWTGEREGDIGLDPRFVDADGLDNNPATWQDNNYRLRADSPCIDAGKNEDWMQDALDLDGNPRIVYGRTSITVDMGAYEYGSFSFRIVGIKKEGGGETNLLWSSRSGYVYVVWSCGDLLGGLWVEETTVPSNGSRMSWIDPRATTIAKFYRIEMKKR